MPNVKQETSKSLKKVNFLIKQLMKDRDQMKIETTE